MSSFLNKRNVLIILLFVSIMLIGSMSTVSANSVHISSNNANLKDVVGSSYNGDVIRMSEGNYAYNKHINSSNGIIVSKNLTFVGAKKGKVVIDAGKNNNIFNIRGNGLSVSFINITFKNCKGNAITNNYSNNTMTFIDCIFRDNEATDGIIYNYGENKLIVTNSSFINNSGNGIYNYGAQCVVSNFYFINNTGRAIYNFGVNFTVINSSFINNYLGDYGDVIFNTVANFIIANSSFINNQGNFYSSIIDTRATNCIVINSSFINNSLGNSDSVIDNRGSAFMVVNSSFINNTGRAINNDVGGANFTVINSFFINNSCNDFGAAILSNAVNCMIINSSFVNNSANKGGSAIYSWKTNFTVINSSFINNIGGGMSNSGTNCMVINSSFVNNSAMERGGAISNTGLNFTVINSSFVNNQALTIDGGGAIFNSGVNCTVINSSFIDNFAKDYIYNNDIYALAESIKRNVSKNVSSDQYVINLANAVLNWVQLNIVYPPYTGNYDFSEFFREHGYTYDNITNPNLVLRSGYGICDGTARLTVALLNILNIPSVYLSGYGTGIYANFTHAWPMVYILNTATGVYEWMPGESTSSYANNFNPNAVKWAVNRTFENIIIINTVGAIYNRGDTHYGGSSNVNIINSTFENNLNVMAFNETYSNMEDISNLVLFDRIENIQNISNNVSFTIGKVCDNIQNVSDDLSSIVDDVYYGVKNSPNPSSSNIVSSNVKGTYNKIIKLSATLKSGNKGIMGKVISFYVNGKYVGQGVTNSQGVAYCNYKITSTGTLSVKTSYNGDRQHAYSSKTSSLSVAKLSEIKIKNVAKVKGKKTRIRSTISNLGYNKGTFKLTFKLAKGLTYKKPKVSTGKISYNKKTRTLTWLLNNLKVHKTKAATIDWNLKSKKGKYSLTPKLVKNSNIKLLSNNKLSIKVK